jgi:hypothetical protein
MGSTMQILIASWSLQAGMPQDMGAYTSVNADALVQANRPADDPPMAG